jgi:hypothetical protein
MMANSMHDRFLVRRLPALVRASGPELASFRATGL